MAENKEIVIITDKELAKVDNNLLNTEQLNMLLSKTPKQHKYTRPAKGGGQWTYVTGTYVKKVLNLMFGWDWDFVVKEFRYDMQVKQAIVLGQLTVRVNGRTIIKNQFGRADIKFKTVWNPTTKTKDTTNEPLDLGNDLKAATTDALKKCSSELGVCSDVYAPNEFKAVKVVSDRSTENVPEEIKITIEDINDIEVLMQYANSPQMKPFEKNLKFITLVDNKRKELAI